MKRMGRFCCCFLLTLAFVETLCVSAWADNASSWNFLVILLDDAGWRDLGFTGNDYVETPAMDRLAAEGMRFSQAYATHPFCSPTRESLVTGQWPARTAWMQRSEIKNPDAPRKAPPFSPVSALAWTQRPLEFTSLAEALKAGGYVTGHFGKWHFDSKARDVSPASEGFDTSFGGANHVGAVKSFFAPFKGLPGDVKSRPGEYLTDRLTDETIAFIRGNKDRPFYAQLWHYAPHTPIQAPPDLVEKYRKKRRELGDDNLNPTYAAMMERIDSGVGRLLAALEELGLRERTVVLLTSDNGAEAALGSVPVTSLAPLRGCKEWLYEGGIRVPMVIVWPGHAKPGSVCDSAVSVLDFYPTILGMAGLPLPGNQPVDGLSLVPVLEGKPEPVLEERPLFWYDVKSEEMADGSLLLPAAVVRLGPWKLIRHFGGETELFQLEDDPSESRNVAGSHPEKVEELGRLLDAWLAEVGVALPVPNPDYDPAFVVPHQVPESEVPTGAKVLRQWKPGADDGIWKADRMVRVESADGVMKIRPAGAYPEILTNDVKSLPAGKYAVKLRLRVPTSGRVRFHWNGEKDEKGVLEFFPNRDGKWHTLAGLFQTPSPLKELRLAAPTHLEETGHYDPAIHTDNIEISDIELLSIP